MMSESFSAQARAKNAGDAAALSLIDIRRVDRTARKTAKAGDLTSRLKKPLNGEAPPVSMPAIAAPQTAPVITPPLIPSPQAPAVAAFVPEPPPVARRAAPLPEPYVAPEPPPTPSTRQAPAQEPPRVAPLPYDDLRSADDLVYYWDELRAGRELPLFARLDRTRIAISWPDTVMVNYGADQAAMPQIARLSRLTGAVEFTSLVTEWILSCSRQVARIGKAMETQRAFNGTRSQHSYRMLLFPFANAAGVSDHVLCHLSCAD